MTCWKKIIVLSAALFTPAAFAEPPVPPQPVPPAPPAIQFTDPAAPTAVLQYQAVGQGAIDTRVAQYWAVEAKKEKAAYLGVSGSPLSPVLREQLKLPNGIGMVVDFVEPKSPADEAGIKQYDVLHKVGDQLIVNAHQLAVLVRMHKPGDEITLTAIHQAESKSIKAKLIEKELMALDDRSPWGVPPGPWGNSTATFYPTPIQQGVLIPANGQVNTIYSNPVPIQAAPNAFLYPGTDIASQIQSTDDHGTLTLLMGKSGRMLIVKDKDGKSPTEYRLDTDEQLQQIPPEIREKVKRMEGHALPILNSTTQPTFGPVRLKTPDGQIQVDRLEIRNDEQKKP